MTISQICPEYLAIFQNVVFFSFFDVCCRFTNTLVYYGLSIHSVGLLGNKYLNFILTNGVEVPAFILSGIIMKKVNRRISQSSAFFLSGIACLVCEFIPPGMIIYCSLFDCGTYKAESISKFPYAINREQSIYQSGE